MKYFLKRNRTHKLLVLTGLLSLILNSFINLQAQAIVERENSEDSDKEQVSPSVVLVPFGSAVITSMGDNLNVTVRVVDLTQFGTLWTNPANFFPNSINTTAQMPLTQSWDTTKFQGQFMRGLSVSYDGTRIYAATHPYAGANKTPNIYRITSPSPTNATLLATLPFTTAYGIGAIDLDEIHGQVFASNMDDGKIYRVNASTGAILGSAFDPLTADASGANMPPMGEIITAVAYNRADKRLYYCVLGRTMSGGSGVNTIRSIGIASSGAFNAPSDDKLEFTLANSQSPAGDIEFNVVGNRMLVAEDPIYEPSPNTLQLNAHQGRVLEYVKGSGGVWAIDPAVYAGGTVKYEIGRFGNRTNSRGGVTWMYSTPLGNTVNGNEKFIVATADALNYPAPYIYGLQFTPATGGSAGGGSLPANSLLADLDYDIGNVPKAIYGDVDMPRPVSPTSAEVSIGGRVTSADGTGIGKVLLTLIEQNGSSKTVMTNPFGYFQFDAVGVGQTVIVTITSKRFSFEPSTRVIAVEDEIVDLNFTAEK